MAGLSPAIMCIIYHIMTNLEIQFYQRVPNELHKLNEKLSELIDILVYNQIDDYLRKDNEEDEEV